MKLRPFLMLVAVILGLTVSLASRAAAPAAPSASDAVAREIPIVVVDSLNPQSGAITDYDRIAIAFERLAKQRHWPATPKVERFAANSPDHGTEIRIVNRKVREETPGELTFRGWTTLTIDGRKHDFGIVVYRMYPRLGENMEDTLDKVFLGAAAVIADKVEPLLFPDLPKRRK